MALITCSKCGKQISSKAKFCPKCGNSQHIDPPAAAGPVPVSVAAAIPPPTNEPNTRATVVDDPLLVSPAAAKIDIISPPPEEPPLQPETSPLKVDELVEEWYYVNGAGRQGPVSFDMLKKYLAAGKIEETTLIWNSGMPDWVQYGKYPELSVAPAPLEAPAPLPVTENLVFLSWALALAPLWGSIVQIFVTELWVALTHKPLSYYSQLWWLTVSFNVLTSYIDYRNMFSNRPEDLRSMGKGLFLLVPIYIHRRDKILNANVTKLCVWVGTCLLSVILFHYLNSWYVQVSK